MIVQRVLEAVTAAIASELSDRERDILGLMADGFSNHAICSQLWLSPKTVESHVHNIFLKLQLRPDGANNRRVIAVLAYRQAHAA